MQFEFYSTGRDNLLILEAFLKERCSLHEWTSRPDCEPKTFNDIGDIANYYDIGDWASCRRGFRFIACIPGAGKIYWQAATVKGHTQYSVNGWGGIHLMLNSVEPGYEARSSFYVHNESGARQKMEDFFDELGDVDAWDWNEIRRVTRRIKRTILNASVSMMLDYPVLPDAHSILSDED